MARCQFNEIHLRTAIDGFFARCRSKNRFSLSLTPLLLFKQSIRAFAQRHRNTGKIAGVLKPRNGKKQTSNQQMKKLFDSGELGPAESKYPRRTTEDDLVLRRSLFRPTRTRESTSTILSLQKMHEGVEYFEPSRSRSESLQAAKNHQGGLGNSEDESDAKIFSLPNFETGQQSAPHIQLNCKLMPRQPQQA